MQLTLNQRTVTLGIIAVQVIGLIPLTIYQIGVGASSLLITIIVATLLIYSGLFVAYYRNIEWVRYIVVIMATILVAVALPEPYLTLQVSLGILTPSVLALVMAEGWWIVGCASIAYVLLLTRAGFAGIYTDGGTITIYIMLVMGISGGRALFDRARLLAEKNAAEAIAARSASEAQAQMLEQQTSLLEAQNAEQQTLLTLVSTLEIPVVSLADGVLFAPIVGHLDSRRAAELTTRLLEACSQRRTRLLVLDIAGVPTVDTAVAQALVRAGKAVRLLGCRVVLSGISVAVATTLTSLGVIMDMFETVRSPQEALALTNSDHDLIALRRR